MYLCVRCLWCGEVCGLAIAIHSGSTDHDGSHNNCQKLYQLQKLFIADSDEIFIKEVIQIFVEVA
jgi:hypothetical protein